MIMVDFGPPATEIHHDHGMPHPRTSASRVRGNHGVMTDPELIRRAEAAGITTSYENWQRQRVDVPPQTLEAILAALAQASPTPAGPPTSAHAGVDGAAADSTEVDAPVPGERSWGFTVQLYSVQGLLGARRPAGSG